MCLRPVRDRQPLPAHFSVTWGKYISIQSGPPGSLAFWLGVCVCVHACMYTHTRGEGGALPHSDKPENYCQVHLPENSENQVASGHSGIVRWQSGDPWWPKAAEQGLSLAFSPSHQHWHLQPPARHLETFVSLSTQPGKPTPYSQGILQDTREGAPLCLGEP